MSTPPLPAASPPPWSGLRRWWLAALMLAGLSGCATFAPVDRVAITSVAIGLSQATTLGRIASGYSPGEDQSGFRLMPLGKFSLDTRVELARRAEVSLDVQYYHLEVVDQQPHAHAAISGIAQRAQQPASGFVVF